MNTKLVIDIARELVANDKGLLAIDESNPTCNKRFAKLGIPQTVEARRDYRELIVTTPGLGECISATAPPAEMNTTSQWKRHEKSPSHGHC